MTVVNRSTALRPGALVRTAGVFSALLVTLSACDAVGPGVDEDDDLREEIERRRGAWTEREVRDYAFTLRRLCFCPPEFTGPVRIEVRRGEVAQVRRTDGTDVDPARWHLYPTVDGVFAILLDAVDRRADSVAVEWSEELPSPRTVFIDYRRATADEELGFELDGLEPLEEVVEPLEGG